MAKPEYEKVASGQYGVYRPKPQKKSGWGAVVGFIILLLIIGALFA